MSCKMRDLPWEMRPTVKEVRFTMGQAIPTMGIEKSTGEELRYTIEEIRSTSTYCEVSWKTNPYR